MALMLVSCSHCGYPNLTSPEVCRMKLEVQCEKCEKWFVMSKDTAVLLVPRFDSLKNN